MEIPNSFALSQLQPARLRKAKGWPADGCLNPSTFCTGGIGESFVFTPQLGITYGWWIESRDDQMHWSGSGTGNNFGIGT